MSAQNKLIKHRNSCLNYVWDILRRERGDVMCLMVGECAPEPLHRICGASSALHVRLQCMSAPIRSWGRQHGRGHVRRWPLHRRDAASPACTLPPSNIQHPPPSPQHSTDIIQTTGFCQEASICEGKGLYVVTHIMEESDVWRHHGGSMEESWWKYGGIMEDVCRKKMLNQMEGAFCRK